MKISFTPSSEFVEKFVESPVPAIKTIPEWYKKSPAFKPAEVTFDDNFEPKLFLKNCMPFIDALSAGYVQKTWCDIHISVENGELKYRYTLEPQILGVRDKVSVDVTGFYEAEFVWRTQWRATLPKGYSLLITHPLNRLDLPFQTMTGFVDADEFQHAAVGNIPFFIKEGFQGIIPAGTPMLQMIPIKRDNWEMSKNEFDEEKYLRLDREIRKKFWGGYKDLFRQKKSYT
jgi:hypothetical protein